MLFCPCCGTMLLVRGDSSTPLFACQACSFIYEIDRPLASRMPLRRKQVDDVMGGADAWKNVDATDAVCPRCGHGRAYYMQIQIRSADEPMSIFYKCCLTECGHQWRDG